MKVGKAHSIFQCDELRRLSEQSSSAFAEYQAAQDNLRMVSKKDSAAWQRATGQFDEARKKLRHAQKQWFAHRDEHHCD
jgi:hypothetical protein